MYSKGCLTILLCNVRTTLLQCPLNMSIICLGPTGLVLKLGVIFFTHEGRYKYGLGQGKESHCVPLTLKYPVC